MTRVLITGLGIVSGLGDGPAEFTSALRAGRSAVRTQTAADGPVLGVPFPDPGLEAALAGLPGLDERLAGAVARAGRRAPVWIQVALRAATQAWHGAGLRERPVPADRIGIVVGGSNLTSAYVLEQSEVFARQPQYLPARYPLHADDAHQIGVISEALSITGEGFTVGASSSSGNAAIIHAARMIQVGAADVCLAVGGMLRLDRQTRAGLDRMGVLAPAGALPHPRPFDCDRNGFVPAEAAACLVLESERSADARGSGSAWAEIVSTAQVLDGSGLSRPNPEGEERAMRTVLARAGLTARDVDYVNAHATATPAGDDAEARALTATFGSARPWVNSTKALAGHALTAAGTLEAVATVIQVHDGFVHANTHLASPINGGMRLAGQETTETIITYALSNSFGFNGFNSSILLRRC